MTLTAILEIVSGILKFPDAIYKFVLLLKKTPQEKHDALLGAAQAEADKFEQTGRPTW